MLTLLTGFQERYGDHARHSNDLGHAIQVFLVLLYPISLQVSQMRLSIACACRLWPLSPLVPLLPLQAAPNHLDLLENLSNCQLC